MKTVVITGVGKGIGRALANTFLANGYRVIGTVLKTKSSIGHPNFEPVFLDLTDPGNINVAVTRIHELSTTVDILINNAGVLLDEEETTVVEEKLRDTLEVNLFGTIAFTEQMIPLIAKGGHILNVSSTAGSIALTGKEDTSHFPGHYPAYKISKAALNMYAATLANRLKPQDIFVSSVHPGWVKTDMGGSDADMTPAEAALGIYQVAIGRESTGRFWFGKRNLPW